MAFNKWNGVASAAQHTERYTVGGTIEVGDEFKITLTDEGGTSYTMTHVAASTVVATVAAAIVSDCQAMTDEVFTAINWSNPLGGIVQAQSATAGRPIHSSIETTESGGGAADAQTFQKSTTVARSGPFDYTVDANWSTGTAPTGADQVLISDSDYPILYGLQQTSDQLEDFQVTKSMYGEVGDIDNGFPLAVTVDNSADAAVRIDAENCRVFLDGKMDTMIVTACNGAQDAFRLGSSANINNLYFEGGRCVGKATIDASCTIDNIHQIETPGLHVEMGTGISSLDVIRGVNFGKITNNSDVNATDANVILAGGTYIQEAGTVGNIEAFGVGVNIEWNTTGDLGNNSADEGLKLYGGARFSTRKTGAASRKIYNADIHGSSRVEDTIGTTWGRASGSGIFAFGDPFIVSDSNPTITTVV